MTFAEPPFANMRRDGVPQVIRMKTAARDRLNGESVLKCRDDDLAVAKEFMERGYELRKSAAVVTVLCQLLRNATDTGRYKSISTWKDQ